MGEVPTIRTFPSGAHIAEVEIDPATGMVRLDRYTAVDDAGHVINHTLVEGQIHGGMAQGIGQVFGEHAMYDEATGQLLAGSFMDYYMPRAGLLKNVKHFNLRNIININRRKDTSRQPTDIDTFTKLTFLRCCLCNYA